MTLAFKFWLGFFTSKSFRRIILCSSDRFCNVFPSVFKRLTFKPGATRYTRLHIILRANDKVMNLNASRQLEAIGLKTKSDILRLSVRSLAAAANLYVKKYGKENLAVTIVHDNLSQEGKSLIRNLFQTISIPTDFIPSEVGNGPTFRKQISIALHDPAETLVAICEDDYLFNEKAFTASFELFNAVPGLIGFTPHNHPNTIRLCLPTQLYKLNGSFYQLTHTTTCTFFTGADTICRYKKTFLRYNGKEENSINKVWKHNICISPCCWTLAEHLHRSELSPVQTLIKTDLV